MIVECPSCSTRFNLDESRIGERGAKVRCSVCSHSFVVHARITMDEITEVDQGLDFNTTGSDLTAPVPMERTRTEPGGLAFQDNANTTPGAEMLSPHDLIEIDSSEVSELDETTGGFDASVIAGSNETLPGVKLADTMPEMIDFEEVSGAGPPPSRAKPDPFHDPFAVATSPSTQFGDEMAPPSAPAGIGSRDFESHATAVYDVGRLAQMPEAVPDAPDLERDVPGGLGPSDEHEPEAKYQSFSTESSFDRPPKSPGAVARAASFLLTAAMLLAVAGAAMFTLIRAGRLDPKVLGLDHVIAAPEPPLSGGYRDVYPASMRSMLYPTRLGTSLLVVTGEVENRGAERRSGLDVLARLVGPTGEVMASGRAPIGITLEVGELANIVDRRALERVLAEKATQGAARPVDPGKRERFMIVLPSPPGGVRTLDHRVSVVPSAFERHHETAGTGTDAGADVDATEAEASDASASEVAETPKKKRKKGKRVKRAARPE